MSTIKRSLREREREREKIDRERETERESHSLVKENVFIDRT